MITLKAKEGYKYTQAEEVTIEERIYASELCLGKYDSEENWKLISDSEVEEGKKLQEIAMQDRMQIEMPKGE